MNSKCIMPEQPYCPACKHGYIIRDFDDDEFCEWVCLLEDEDC